MSKAGSFIFVITATQSVFRNDGIALHVHERLFRRVDGDPVQPGIKLCLATKLVQRPVSTDKSFLRNIRYEVRVPHHAPNQTFDAPLVFDDQQFVSALVARNLVLQFVEESTESTPEAV